MASPKNKLARDAWRVVDESGEIAISPVEFVVAQLRGWCSDLSSTEDSAEAAAAKSRAFGELRAAAQDMIDARGRKVLNKAKPGGRPKKDENKVPVSDKTVKRRAKDKSTT